MRTTAPCYALVIGQGATLRRNFIWKDSAGAPIPLDGFTARAQVRADYDAEEKILDLSSAAPTADGTLTIFPAEGRIELLVGAERTAALSFEEAVWDLEVEDGDGEVFRLVQGPAMLDPEVTK